MQSSEASRKRCVANDSLACVRTSSYACLCTGYQCRKSFRLSSLHRQLSRSVKQRPMERRVAESDLFRESDSTWSEGDSWWWWGCPVVVHNRDIYMRLRSHPAPSRRPTMETKYLRAVEIKCWWECLIDFTAISRTIWSLLRESDELAFLELKSLFILCTGRVVSQDNLENRWEFYFILIKKLRLFAPRI